VTTTDAPVPVTREQRDSDPAGLPPLHLGLLLAIGATLVAVELAVSARYGYHRDELYFLACARHLAWGYVDQPPFVPAVARLATDLFGLSVVALFFWSAITLLVLRLLRTGNPRLWLAVGAVAGVALLNKYNVAFLLVGLAVGLLLSGHGRALIGRWIWAGAAVALAIWSPNLVWNAQHHWAAFSMLQSLHAENSTLGASIGFIPAQLLVVGPVLIPIWFGGLRRLLHHPVGRPLGIAYLTLLVLYTVAGAKPYYLGGIYFVLFAAGGLWAEQRLDARARPGGLWRLVAWITIGGALTLPLALPVLPVSALASGAWEGKINKDLSATVGWPRVVRQVADVAATLRPAERAHLVVFTGDYGAAGAVDLSGGRYGLPHAISGHNTYWLWGPSGARTGATTIAVDLPRSYLLTIFAQVTPAGTVDTGHGVWTEERGDPIWICRDQQVSWARAWPAAKHYG
jgi:hypothetical protein